MKKLIALTWKEWHESQAYLWIGLGVFAGLPVIGAIEAIYQHVSRHLEISAAPWVLIFGGVLSIFAGVGATCRDLSGKLEDFWRSRPLGGPALMRVKFVVGLLIILIACTCPLLLELFFTKDALLAINLLWMGFLWPALYSIGFLAGCLIRRTAQAAMLSLTAMMLIWLVPIAIPKIQFLSPAVALQNNNYGWEFYSGRSLWSFIWTATYLPEVRFAIGMLVIATVALILSILAVAWNWHIQSGQKLMYGSIGGAFLLLLATISFRVGANMPVLQQFDLGPNEQIIEMHGNETGGYILTTNPGLRYRLYRVNPTGIVLGPAISVSMDKRLWEFEEVSPPNHPEIRYSTDGTYMGDTGNLQCRLEVLSLLRDTVSLPLWDWEKIQNAEGSYSFAQAFVNLYIHNDRLYALWNDKLAVFDISDPLNPKQLSNGKLSGKPPAIYDSKAGFVIDLPIIPELSPMERLHLLLDSDLSSFYMHTFDGQTLSEISDNGDVLTYNLSTLIPTKAEFTNGKVIRSSMLDSIFGSVPQSALRSSNGLVYSIGQGGHKGLFNSTVVVWAARGPHAGQTVGHFGAPSIQYVQPLLDGRCIAFGDKVWVIGPPPGR